MDKRQGNYTRVTNFLCKRLPISKPVHLSHLKRPQLTCSVQNDFCEHIALKKVLACDKPQRHIILKISDYSYDVYHNLLYSLYTNHFVGRAPSSKDASEIALLPTFCNQEELYALADKLQMMEIRDRVGALMVRAASGKTILEALFGALSAIHTQLYEEFYIKFKTEWSSLRPLLATFLDELAEEDRTRAMKIMGRAFIEMQFQVSKEGDGALELDYQIKNRAE